MRKAGRKFELRAPSPQAAVDIFAGRWATDLSHLIPVAPTGGAAMATDPRPRYALKHFAGPDGTLAGKRVLELGPLEAGHSHRLEQLGAEVLAVEANAEAYLKCLILKELLSLERTRFLFGDFMEYMKSSTEIFDLVFASGVLYHSDDPAELIRLAAQRAPRLFLWTHVYAPGRWRFPKSERVERNGIELTYYRRTYRNRSSGAFWGGNHQTACLLSREDLMLVLAHNGYAHIDVHREEPDHPRGPCLSLSAWR